MAFGLEIEYVPLDSIKPYKNNAKKHPPEQIKQIANSISEFGMADPIAVCNNIIVEGHGRYLACKELNYNEVPIIRLDWLTEEQRKAYTLIHNKLTLNSDFDLEVLNRELDGILDLDMASFGFDVEEEQKPTEPTDDNYDAPIPVAPKSRPGDIYELGQHRVMCGDSTDPDDVATLMDGAVADLVVTDPPYGVEYTGNKRRYTQNAFNSGKNRVIKNDDMEDAAMLDFLTRAFKNMSDAMRPGAAYYIWFAAARSDVFYAALINYDMKPRQQLIWVKDHMVLGRQDYQWQHEPCLYGWKPGAGHYFINDFTNKTIMADGQPLDIRKLSKNELIELLQPLFDNTTVLEAEKPAKSELHPMMKPIPLFGKFINNSSRTGEIVLDLFGGSGTTVIACEQLKRKAYVMEYDPRYVDVIVDRWEKYTGEKAVKIES